MITPELRQQYVVAKEKVARTQTHGSYSTALANLCHAIETQFPELAQPPRKFPNNRVVYINALVDGKMGRYAKIESAAYSTTIRAWDYRFYGMVPQYPESLLRNLDIEERI